MYSMDCWATSGMVWNDKLMKRCNAAIFIIVMFITISLSTYIALLHSYTKIDAFEKDITSGLVECCLQHDDIPFEFSLAKYQSLYSRLCSLNYYEIYSQPLECLDRGKWFFDSFTEELSQNTQSAKCVQVSQNVIDKFQLEVEIGKAFTEKDYWLSTNIIPVILGSEYIGKYDIGDVFSADYLFEHFHFQVIGFLRPLSTILMVHRHVFLDNAILMPSFCVNNNREETDGLLVHYANKTSGMILMDKHKFRDDYSKIRRIVDSAETGKYNISLAPVSAQYEMVYGLSIDEALLGVLFLEIICIVILIWNSYIMWKCRMNKQWIVLMSIMVLVVRIVVDYLGEKITQISNDILFWTILNVNIALVMFLLIHISSCRNKRKVRIKDCK